MIRLAAVADLHCSLNSAGRLAPAFASLEQRADVLLLAGDLTSWGTPAEAEILRSELAGISIPIVAVLGNHDHHHEQPETVQQILTAGGIHVLEKQTWSLRLGRETLGIVGSKGFGGGFGEACVTPFGEPEIKLFLRETFACAEAIEHGLSELQTDYRVVLLHYSPIRGTLEGEHPEIFPFLGSSLLAEPIDDGGADLVLHGHAHGGTERGRTPGGIPVRNCAIQVLKRNYALYELHRTSAH